MGSATVASTRNFQRQLENAIQYAIGKLMRNNKAETVNASCSVSQIVCQSIAMALWYSAKDYNLHPACWWNDTVQSKVNDHLSIVVEAMSCKGHSKAQAGHRAFAPRALDGAGDVCLIDRAQRFVSVVERVLQILDDVGFRRDRSRPHSIVALSGARSISALFRRRRFVVHRHDDECRDHLLCGS